MTNTASNSKVESYIMFYEQTFSAGTLVVSLNAVYSGGSNPAQTDSSEITLS